LQWGSLVIVEEIERIAVGGEGDGPPLNVPSAESAKQEGDEDGQQNSGEGVERHEVSLPSLAVLFIAAVRVDLVLYSQRLLRRSIGYLLLPFLSACLSVLRTCLSLGLIGLGQVGRIACLLV